MADADYNPSFGFPTAPPCLYGGDGVMLAGV